MDESALLAIQEECFAEDVPLPDDASEWSEAEVRAYFESGGGDVPARRLPLPSSRLAGPAREVESIAIGGVELAVSVPEAPELVAWVPTALADSMAASQDALATARWMMVQLRLGQDMLLLGEPGGRVRLLVLWLCSILRLEVEYVGVTRDTSEADLKQRRELRGGSVLYSDAPPLRAATRGRVLILEGVEKAERNVLPLLNNLLENREMSLDDGTFLTAPSCGSEAELLSGASEDDRQDAPQHSGAGEARVRLAKRGFVVIGIGLPQPTYAGTPLDPPLRSRFATRRVCPIGGSEAVRSLLSLVPALPPDRARQVVATVDALRLRAASTSGGADSDRRLPFFAGVSAEAVARLLFVLPQLSTVEAIERRLPLPALRMSPATVEAVRREVAALLPPPARAMRYASLRVVGGRRQPDGPMYAEANGGGMSADGNRAGQLDGDLGVRGDAEGEPCGQPTACVCTFCPVDSDGVLRSGSQVEVPAPCGRGALWQPGRSGTSEPPLAAGVGGGGDGSPSAAEIGAMGVGKLKALLTSRAAPHAHLIEKSELRQLALETCGGGGGARGEDWRAWQGDGVRLVDSQLDTLHAMCQEHALGHDVCILSRRGLGKTTLARRLAALFGYGQPHTVFCHHELPAHELLQRRATDPNGDTVWRDSPLLTAAKAGGLALLDGIHRLPRGTLAGALATLCTDRSLPTLPDGSRLVSPNQWEQLCRSGLSPAQLHERGVWRVHPSFRIIATAEPAAEERGTAQATGWLNDEVLPLFAWVRLAPPPDAELAQMLHLSACAPAALPTLRALLDYRTALEAASAAEPSLRGAVPTQRQLLRAADLLRRRPGDAAGALRRATGAALLTVPPAARETAHALLVQAAHRAGVPTSAVPPQPGMEGGLGGDGVSNGGTPAPSAEEAAAERARRERQARETEELEGLAIQRRMMGNFGGMGSVLDAKLDDGVRKMQEARRAATDERVGRVCQEAAAMADITEGDGGTRDGAAASGCGTPVIAIQVSDGRVSIGDVSVARRTPIEHSLVPSPSFVPIAGHVALLREMLMEWEGGGHLLLLGDQGVGKNKLADKLLQLLGAEREYVQLHRDTTVASLTLAPCLEGGTVSWRDSPLVRAARLGRVLVVDEADKAPLEVVCVLKALAEDGDLTLGDGRRLVCSRFARSSHDPATGNGAVAQDNGGDGHLTLAAEDAVVVSPAFRMLVLANPPGFPFQGNDFYRECGDVFGALAVPNPDAHSQAQLLRRVAPALPRQDLATLLSLFARLRILHAQGQLAYPYSVRGPGSTLAHCLVFSPLLPAFPRDS
jgi:MoxR-like ATPase